MPPETDADQVLMERAKRDPQAFGILFERHFDAVFGYILRRSGDWNAAQDLSSEVFLKALRGAWRFRFTGVPVSAWLLAIATNELRMYFRRGRRAPRSLDALMEESGLAPIDPRSLEAEKREAALEQERREEFVRVRSALLELPLKYQEVIALRYFEQKSVPEVAAILGKREGTVKSLLSRGIARLRVLLR